MKFVIQHNLMNEEQLQLTLKAVNKYPHMFVGVIPFSHEITSDEPLTGTDFIPYGSTLFTTLALERGWKGLHFDLSTFDYEVFCENRDDMLNDYYVLEVPDAIIMLNTDHFEGKQIFTRPSKDLKQFSGQVMDARECAAWLKDAMACASSGSYQLSETDKVVIAPPKNVQAEWRWFVVGGQVISGSMYRAHGQINKKRETDPEVIREAQHFADKWLPDECCVMDLALVDGRVKVIEFNCINSSGFYDNDVEAIFDALYAYHEKK